VHSPLPWRSDFLELGGQAFAHRLPADRVVTRLVVGPTDVGETQKIKGLRFSFSALLPALSGEAPKFDPARLFRVQFQPELPQAFPEFVQKTLCLGPMRESRHGVIRIAHDDDIAARLLLPPLLPPEIQDVVQVEVRQDRRDPRPLRTPLLRLGPLPLFHHPRLPPLWDQAGDTPVSDPMFHKLDPPVMLEFVEKGSDVQVHDPVHSLAHDPYPERVQSLLRSAPRAESVAEAQKVLFP